MSNTVSNYVSSVNPTIKEVWTVEKSKSRRRSIVREFALNTSTHGLPGMARSESKHNCIFWLISFLIFAGVMIFFVVQSIQDYFQYPTQTSVSVTVERSSIFPAVTFCNYSPLRYDRFIKPFLNYTNSIGITNTNDTTNFTPQQAQAIYDFLQWKINANESMVDYFFDLNSILLSCSYNYVKCTSKDFISFPSSRFGLCYTFNAKMKYTNQSQVRNTTDDGGPGILLLSLYINRDLYVPYVAEEVSAGMVAMIHDNTQLPIIEVSNIGLAPGRRHQLSYKKRSAYSLPSPYTDCTTEVSSVMQAMYNRYQGADYAYSQGVCHTLCIQAYIYEICKCVSSQEWTARSIILPGTNTIIEAVLCNRSDTCYAKAKIAITTTPTIWDMYCSNCKEACSTVDFIVTPSSVEAPSDTTMMIVKGLVESSRVERPTNWSTDWQSHIANNYVSLQVVYGSSQVEIYTQEATISAVDVLSNVGGHSGLWIGISFLSIMEFIEMLYRLSRYQFLDIKQMIRNKTRRRI